MSFDLVKSIRRWRVSQAWLTKRFRCNLSHILDPHGCGGRCCKNPSLWPPRAFPNNVCGHLGEQGCVLPLEQRPITCILFPVIPMKTAPFDADNNTLVIYQRVIFPTSMCKGAYKHPEAQMVIDMVATELKMIFGAAEYSRVRHDLVDLGVDSYFDVSDAIMAEFARDIREDDYENKIWTPPAPRDYITR